MKMLNDYQYVSAKKAIQSLTEVFLQTGDKYFQTKRDELENYLEVTDTPQFGANIGLVGQALPTTNSSK